jgi:signal transduction histidine kinase
MRRLSAPPRIAVRQLLVALSLAGIVPLAIVATVLLVALWRAHQAGVQEATRSSAHAAGRALEQRLDGTLRRLAFLGALQPAGELDRLRQRFPEILVASPEWHGLGALTARDAVLPHHKQLLQGDPVIHGLEVGVPVMSGASVAYALVATLDPGELAALLRAQLGEAAAAIVDRDAGVLARTAEADPLGQREGAPVYRATVPIRGTRWSLSVSRSAGSAELAARRSFAGFAALLIIVLVANGLFAWLLGRRLADALQRQAQRASAAADARIEAAQEESRRRADDRTAALDAEKRVREHAEAANRAKDEFLAMLGHELRNPLGAIGSAMRVIERVPSNSADHKAARDIVARQTAHLAKIVDDLLDVGRVVSGRTLLRRNLVDLAQACTAAVAAVHGAEQEPAHEWMLELGAVLVSADPTRIDQVLGNLLGNAAKFTPPGGRIRVALREQAGEAVLVIEDSGPGIRRELLPHIFDLFSKENPDQAGLGIGLALVKRLVELHGGSVQAENLEQGGARFTVRLPAIPEPEPLARPDARPLPVPRPTRQARVLIVEDNDDARVTLQRVLQADGHLVSAARDARAGLEAAAAGSPNIAVVDIGLPGMDGYQFARELRERLGSGVRLIALTGYGTHADRKRSSEAGFDAHLTKPVDLERLLALITEAAS